MRTLFLITTLLLSTAASAQVTLRFANGNQQQDTLTFGPNDCGGRTIRVTWTRNAATPPCQQLDLWLTANSCGDSIKTNEGDVELDDIETATFQNQTTGNFEFDISDLPFSNPDGGGSGCGSLSQEKTFRVCGSTRFQEYYACSNTVTRATEAKVVYDGEPPDAPSFASVAGVDQAVSVRLNEPDDANEVVVVVMQNGTEVKSKRQGVAIGAIRVEGLENDVTYQVQAYAVDEAGNESARTESVDVTPTRSVGFYERYRELGGAETGGCGATGGGLAGSAMLSVLGFWLFSRRNRS